LVVDTGNNMQVSRCVSQCRPLLTFCRRAKRQTYSFSSSNNFSSALQVNNVHLQEHSNHSKRIYKNHIKIDGRDYSTTSCLCKKRWFTDAPLPVRKLTNAEKFDRLLQRGFTVDEFMESPLSDEEANSVVDYDKYSSDLGNAVNHVISCHEKYKTKLPAPTTESDVTLYNVSKLLDDVYTEDGTFQMSELTHVSHFNRTCIKIHLNRPEYMDELVKVLVESKMSIEMKDCCRDARALAIPSLPDLIVDVRKYEMWAKDLLTKTMNFMQGEVNDLVEEIENEQSNILTDVMYKDLIQKIISEYFKFHRELQSFHLDQVLEVRGLYGITAEHMDI